MELILEDDSSEKEDPPSPDPEKVKQEQLEHERNEEAKRQQAILQKETVIVKNELEELMFKADERKFEEELKKGAKAEQEALMMQD